jgi:hypothetical protein
MRGAQLADVARLGVGNELAQHGFHCRGVQLQRPTFEQRAQAFGTQGGCQRGRGAERERAVSQAITQG